MTSESQAYIYVQLPSTLNTVPAALLKVEKLRDGTFVGRFRYGDRYLERKGIPGAVRDAAPDAWGRRVIEHKLQRSPGDLEEIDYLLNGPQDGAGYLSFGTSVEPPASKRRYNRTHQLAELVAAAKAIDATFSESSTRPLSWRVVAASRFAMRASNPSRTTTCSWWNASTANTLKAAIFASGSSADSPCSTATTTISTGNAGRIYCSRTSFAAGRKNPTKIASSCSGVSFSMLP